MASSPRPPHPSPLPAPISLDPSYNAAIRDRVVDPSRVDLSRLRVGVLPSIANGKRRRRRRVAGNDNNTNDDNTNDTNDANTTTASDDLDRLARALARAGVIAPLVSDFEIKYASPASDIMTTILISEASSNLDFWARAGESKLVARQDFWPPLLRLAQLVPAARYLHAQKARGALAAEVLGAMRDANVDAFIGDAGDLLAASNLIGMATVVTPLGFDDDDDDEEEEGGGGSGSNDDDVKAATGKSPRSVAFFAAPYDDGIALALAKAWQQFDDEKTHLRRPVIDAGRGKRGGAAAGGPSAKLSSSSSPSKSSPSSSSSASPPCDPYSRCSFDAQKLADLGLVGGWRDSGRASAISATATAAASAAGKGSGGGGGGLNSSTSSNSSNSKAADATINPSLSSSVASTAAKPRSDGVAAAVP